MIQLARFQSLELISFFNTDKVFAISKGIQIIVIFNYCVFVDIINFISLATVVCVIYVCSITSRHL